MTPYDLVAEAIAHLTLHASQQPSLDALASRFSVSPFYLQRTFRKYAGVSPKQFLAALTLERAKGALASNASVLDATLETGLSSPARLHDHFVTLEAMTPGDFKRGGAGTVIRFGAAPSPFGPVVAGSTSRGICTLLFLDGTDVETAIRDQWPLATLVRDDSVAEAAAAAWSGRSMRPVRLHVRGTNFQVRVWQAMLRTSCGQLTSYAQVARSIGAPGAARATGNALAANPVAVLIPCHRVLASTDVLGNYRWGSGRKRALIAWESAKQKTGRRSVPPLVSSLREEMR